jgi:hypothetical protein
MDEKLYHSRPMIVAIRATMAAAESADDKIKNSIGSSCQKCSFPCWSKTASQALNSMESNARHQINRWSPINKLASLNIKLEQCVAFDIQLLRSRAGSTGRDGDGEHGNFSGFLPWPTKRQSSAQPVQPRSFQEIGFISGLTPRTTVFPTTHDGPSILQVT